MTIDEKAVTAAMKALGKKHGTLRESVRAAIEAYESARTEPNPWRPIEEAPRDGTWILVLIKGSHHGPGMLRWDDDAWIDGNLECVDLDFLLKEDSMFRTIDPPTQDRSQSGLGVGTAAGTGS